MSLLETKTRERAEKNDRLTLIMGEIDTLENTAHIQKRELTNEELDGIKPKADEAGCLNSDIAKLDAEIKTLQTVQQTREYMAQPSRPVPSISMSDNQVRSHDKIKDDLAMANWRSYLSCDRPSMFPRERLRDLVQSTDSAGGYLNAPAVWSENLIKSLDNSVFVRNAATVLPPLRGSDTQGFPVLSANPSDFDWQTSETADISSQNDTALAFGQRTLFPAMCTKHVIASRKLLAITNYPIEQFIRNRIEYVYRGTLEKAYLTDTASNNRPYGIFYAHASGIPTTQDVTTATAAVFTADEIKDTVAKVNANYWDQGLMWVMHPSNLMKVRKLKDGVGRYLFDSAGGNIVNGIPGTLEGIPVRVSQFAPSATTTGVYAMALCHMPSYWIIDINTFQVDRLDELLRLTQKVIWVADFHTTGAPTITDAFSRLKYL